MYLPDNNKREQDAGKALKRDPLARIELDKPVAAAIASDGKVRKLLSVRT
jgi:hypothetical protein